MSVPSSRKGLASIIATRSSRLRGDGRAPLGRPPARAPERRRCPAARARNPRQRAGGRAPDAALLQGKTDQPLGSTCPDTLTPEPPRTVPFWTVRVWLGT